MRSALALAFAAVLASGAAVRADEVHLRNGKVLEADRVVPQGDKLLLVTEYMTIEVLAADVERIVPTAKAPATSAGKGAPSAAEQAPPAEPRRHCAPPVVPEYGDVVRTADDEDFEYMSSPGGDPRLQEIQRIDEEGDPKGIPALLKFVDDCEAPVHRAALRALGSFDGKDVLTVLLRLVDSPEAARNRGAREGVRRWCERKRSEGSAPLQAALQQVDPVYGGRLLLRASLFDGEWARPVLLYGLEWGRAEVRLAALLSLRRAQDPELPAHLPAALADADWAIRREAAEVCGELEDGVDLGKLIDLLRDPEKRVVEAAHRSLTKLTGMEIPPDEREWREWWNEARGW